MAVEIKSGAGTDLATVDATSKAIRVTNYDSAGAEIVQSLPISIATSSVTIVDNDIIGALDVSTYKFVSLQLTGTWAGTVSFQGSNDNGTFYDMTVQDPSALATPYVKTMTANGVIKIPCIFKFLRVRVTAYTSGSVTGVAFGYKEENSTGQISSTGEVTIVDGAGVVAGPMKQSAHGDNHLPVSVIQDAIVSAANSSTTNLGAAQIFSGVSSDSSGHSVVDVALMSSHTSTVQIQQSTDGTNWDIDDSYTIAAATGEAIICKLVSSFFRVLVTNTGAGTTTTFRLQTILTPVSEAMPRGLTQGGNFKVALQEALPTGTNAIGDVTLGGQTVSMGAGNVDAGTQRVSLAADEPVALAAGTEYIGDVKVLPSISAASTSRKIVSAVGVNATNLTTSKSNIDLLLMVSGAATPRFVKLYDQATTPVVGTDVPKYTFELAKGPSPLQLPTRGLEFANGLGVAILLGVADSSTSAFTVAGEVVMMLDYTENL